MNILYPYTETIPSGRFGPEKRPFVCRSSPAKNCCCWVSPCFRCFSEPETSSFLRTSAHRPGQTSGPPLRALPSVPSGFRSRASSPLRRPEGWTSWPAGSTPASRGCSPFWSTSPSVPALPSRARPAPHLKCSCRCSAAGGCSSWAIRSCFLRQRSSWRSTPKSSPTGWAASSAPR